MDLKPLCYCLSNLLLQARSFPWFPPHWHSPLISQWHRTLISKWFRLKNIYWLTYHMETKVGGHSQINPEAVDFLSLLSPTMLVLSFSWQWASSCSFRPWVLTLQCPKEEWRMLPGSTHKNEKASLSKIPRKAFFEFSCFKLGYAHSYTCPSRTVPMERLV